MRCWKLLPNEARNSWGIKGKRRKDKLVMFTGVVLSHLSLWPPSMRGNEYVCALLCLSPQPCKAKDPPQRVVTLLFLFSL